MRKQPEESGIYVKYNHRTFKTKRQLAIDHGCNSNLAPKYEKLTEWVASEPKEDVLVYLRCGDAAELSHLPSCIKGGVVDVHSFADCLRNDVVEYHDRFLLRPDCVGGHLVKCVRLHSKDAVHDLLNEKRHKKS